MGSLYTAVASYLDARSHEGRWLLRVEDLDRARVVPGSAAGIQDTLLRFGFVWDGEVIYQSDRTSRYAAALEALLGRGLTFECSCSRTELADENRYPGHCRRRPLSRDSPTATRLRVEPGTVLFSDRIQGAFRQDVAHAVGDVVVKRRDQVYAYLLAVVIDDAAQGVTHVVRGADLLDHTPRQIYLQQLLELPRPAYAHVPVLTEPDGRKLAKSARSLPIDGHRELEQLLAVFAMLGLPAPPRRAVATLANAWAWAIDHWQVSLVPKRLTSPIPA